ncbi:MAG: JAB domain-containing protein [Clostridiales bacterium]|nr:JAB domain-containing protein [Clostridiales bacterium]
MKTIQLSYLCDSAVNETDVIFSVEQAVKTLRASFKKGEIQMQEYFKAMFLRGDGHVLGIQTLSMGGTRITVVDAKILFSAALLAHAEAIILCHNHPSAVVHPSPDDLRLTQRLVDGARLLDLTIADHIILTEDSYYSMSDNLQIVDGINRVRIHKE